MTIKGPDLPFHSTRIAKQYEVTPLLDVSISSKPSSTMEHPFVLNVDVANLSSVEDVRIQGMITMSPTWECCVVAHKSEYNNSRISSQRHCADSHQGCTVAFSILPIVLRR
jgi:hypothetical protein